MLSYLKLDNFKSFSHIELDLRKAGKPKKNAYIYGENGSGKSNLIMAFMMLSDTLRSLVFTDIKTDAINKDEIEYKKYLHNNFSLESTIKRCRKIGCNEPLSVEFGFNIEGKDGVYTLTFDKTKVISERMEYLISDRRGLHFSIDENGAVLSPSIFHDEAYRVELEDKLSRYWGKHTFFAIFQNEYQTLNKEYIESRISDNFMHVFKWVNNMTVWYRGADNLRGDKINLATPINRLRHLRIGSIDDCQDPELLRLESFLNDFFTSIYSDVKKAYYRFEQDDDEYVYRLYFSKLIDGQVLDIPFSLESTGTQKIMRILPLLFAAQNGATVCIDEIDSGIHDLLMNELIAGMDSNMKGQLIITTHNTSLLENVPQENVYIISMDANANKSINCITDYEKRTQKNHNLQKKYLRGDYGGVPYTADLDLPDLILDILEFSEDEES